MNFEDHSLAACYAYDHLRCRACQEAVRKLYDPPRVLVDAVVARVQQEAAIRDHIEAEQRLAEDLAEFVGKWVAVKDHKVVASADTLAQVMAASSAADADGVWQVPSESVHL